MALVYEETLILRTCMQIWQTEWFCHKPPS